MTPCYLLRIAHFNGNALNASPLQTVQFSEPSGFAAVWVVAAGISPGHFSLGAW